MNEPTHRQHKILETVEALGDSCYKTGNEDDIDLYWELVRGGYLRNLVLIGGGQYEWQFKLTVKAVQYLKSFLEKV